MARTLADYVALALVGDVSADDVFSGFGGTSDFSGDFEQIARRAEQRCEFSISPDVLRQALRTLAECNLLRVTDDPYSGTFYKIRSSRLSAFFDAAHKEATEIGNEGVDPVLVSNFGSDFPNAAALMRHEVFDDYAELGREWLAKALAGLRERLTSGELESSSILDVGIDAPASDRIVTLSHNQIGELEQSTSELIEVVSARNEIEENVNFRDVVLGQLRAGRELIRAGSVRVFVLQITLLDTLRYLAKRYEKEAIGALASALIAALLQHLGISQ